MQPTPYIDEEGNRFYNTRQAAQIVKGVCQLTLWRWAKRGVTSFGFHLDVQQEPMIHDPRGYRHDAKTHRDFRMLIPEAKVLALKEILEAAGKKRPDQLGWSPADRDTLEAVANRRVRPLTLKH